MDWLMSAVDWLKKPENLAIVTALGAGVAAIIKAIWEVYKHYDAKKNKTLEQAPQDKPLAADKSASFPSRDTAALRMAYLRLMAREWRTLPLEVVDHSAADAAARRLTLEQVYISLDTTTPRPESLRHQQQAEEREGPLSAVEALLQAERQRLVLLGQPGSGKSTFKLYPPRATPWAGFPCLPSGGAVALTAPASSGCGSVELSTG